LAEAVLKVFLISFSLSLSFLLPVSAQDTLKVVSFNLAGRKPGTDPDTRLYHTIQNLKALKPDIIGLQEINEAVALSGSDNQAKLIADSLSAFFGETWSVYYTQSHLSWNDQFREMIGIITRFPVKQKSNITLATGAYPRKAVWNLIETPLGTLHFFNTHLDYLNPSVRSAEVNQILDFIALKESQYSSSGTLLTGDFNDIPGSAPIRLLTQATVPFADTFAAANPGATGYTLPAQGPTSRIDFIFMKSTSDLSIAGSEVIMNKPYYLTLYCSDHRGVMTRFTGSSSTGVTGEKLQPEGLSLSPAWPNPFNPETSFTIRFGGKEPVSVSVFTLTGQKVKTLREGLPSGEEWTITWDGRTHSGQPAASGVYLITVQQGGRVKTGKVVLLK